jgi:hypothetical protein
MPMRIKVVIFYLQVNILCLGDGEKIPLFAPGAYLTQNALSGRLSIYIHSCWAEREVWPGF